MELEHKADMAVAECGKFLLPHTVDLCTVNNHRTAIRHIQRTHDCSKVVLPAPLGPTMLTISPFSIARSIPRNTCRLPKLFVIFSK